MLLVMPADHVVTFGITPDRPETGCGYIQAGALVDEGGARTIARFVEKPDLATAEGYLRAGEHLWNSGLFVLRASVWLNTLARCRPDVLAVCEAA